jgi:hypothetical protein
LKANWPWSNAAREALMTTLKYLVGGAIIRVRSCCSP